MMASPATLVVTLLLAGLPLLAHAAGSGGAGRLGAGPARTTGTQLAGGGAYGSVTDDAAAAARSDWILYCTGCHGLDADGLPPRVPRIRGRIGHFLAMPEGRAFLVQVPGMNNSGLDDRRIARLINWLVPRFAGDSLPARFEPYEVDEVARLRATRPRDIVVVRRALGQALQARGTPVD